MVVKKGLSHFLQICIILFISFLTYEYQKNAEFYADFKSVKNNWKKVHPEKVICQKLLQVVV